MRFTNRSEAGRLLANKLLRVDLDYQNTIVIALPKGGVPVGYEIARTLDLPLDVILVKKIAAPYNPELAVGAVSEDGEVFYNSDLLKYLGYSAEEVEPFKKLALLALKKNSINLRQGRIPLDLEHKEVILVDDGIATGASIEVVIQLLRKKNVGKIFLVVPVSSPEAVMKLEKMVDQIVTIITPPVLRSVGEWYQDFTQVETSEVVEILNKVSDNGPTFESIELHVHDPGVVLPGRLYMTDKLRSWVVFAHGSGSSHKSVRNNSVARELVSAGHGVLLFDLLTVDEDKNYSNRFNIPLLTSRLVLATKWLKNSKYYHIGMPIGFFGASTGSAAAISAAANSFINNSIYAIISRGGRPDMVDKTILRSLDIPTLLIVGGDDQEVIKLNEKAQLYLSNSEIFIVPHATHLFEEEGALEEVTRVAINWYNDHLKEFEHEKSLLEGSKDEMNYLNP
jgi:putative phosphoribosyl transferase